MSYSPLQSAVYFAPLFYRAASILESRAGKKLLNCKACRFDNIDADRMYENLQNLFMFTARQARIEDMEFNNTFLANLAASFRDMADELKQYADIKLKASDKKIRFNDDNITPACFDFAETILSQDWYANYPDSRCCMELPNDLSYALYALQSFGRFLFCHKTLTMGTGNKKLDTFVASMSASYLSGAEFQYIHDLLVEDVLSIRKNPKLIIRYNATLVSTMIVDNVSPDPSFVYFDLNTGRVHGESKVMFNNTKALIAA